MKDHEEALPEKNKEGNNQGRTFLVDSSVPLVLNTIETVLQNVFL